MKSEPSYRRERPPEEEQPSEAAQSPPLEAPNPWCSCERSRSFVLDDPETRPQVATPEAAAELLVPLLRGHDREHGVLLALDTKHRLIAAVRVSIGTAQHTFLVPREIFRDALLYGASSIVIGHNHPSGESAPSSDDRGITRRLARAGETLGIEVLDHLVIGSHDWVSLAREGVI